MGGLFGGSKSPTQPAQAAGISINTSVYGLPVPVVYGQTRVAFNLGYYTDFRANKVPNTGSKSGKNGDSNQYNYSASIILLLGEGPVTGVPTCWINQSQFAIADITGATVFTGTYPQTPWSYLTTNHPTEACPYTGINYVAIPNYNMSTSATLPNFNFEIQGIFVGTAFNTFDADPSQVIPDMLSNDKYGMGFPSNRVGALGTQITTTTIPGSPYQISVPSGALSFSFNCDVEIAGVPMTCVAASPAAGQYSFTNAGLYTFNAADTGKTVSITWASLSSLVLNPAGNAYAKFCGASSLWISPAYTQQTQSSTLLQDIAESTYSEFIVTCGILQIIPRGYYSITANGYSYVAPSSVLFNLTDDDFLPNQGSMGNLTSQDPVLLQRTRQSDQINDVKLEYLYRGNIAGLHNYAPAIAESSDQGLIDVFTRRAAPSKQSHLFADGIAAQVSAQLQLQKEYIRNKYVITVDARYCLLDPMDLVNLYDPYLFPDLAGNLQDARIIEITENSDGTLTILLEEYPIGLGTTAAYTLNQGSGYLADYGNATAINQPFIFEPPAGLVNVNPQIWIGASGPNINWGGGDVYLSLDNVSYKLIGHITKACTQGVTTASYAAGSNPDATHTLSVNLSQSFGALTSVSTGDAAKFVTPSVVADDNVGTNAEILSHSTATLTGTNTYNMGGSAPNEVYRGGYSTPIVTHASGSKFCLLDDALLKYDLPVAPIDYVGLILYVKIVSYNVFGGPPQTLATATPYTYTPSGAGTTVLPPASISLNTGWQQQQDGTIQPFLQITWGATTDATADSYEIQWQIHGAGTWLNDKVVPIYASEFDVNPIFAGTTGQAYDVRVRALRHYPQGVAPSSWVTQNNFIVLPKGTSPSACTSVTATAVLKGVQYNWVNPTDTDFDHVEIWLATLVDDVSTATFQCTVKTSSFTFVGYNNGSGGVIMPLPWPYPYCAVWVRAVNTSGVKSGFAPGALAGATATPVTAVSGDIGTSQVQATNIGASQVITSKMSSNAATIPTSVVGGGLSGNGGTQTAASFTVPNTDSASQYANVTVTLSQAMASPLNWSFQVLLNGSPAAAPTGSSGNANMEYGPSVTLKLLIPPGGATVAVNWAADVGAVLYNTFITASTLMR